MKKAISIFSLWIALLSGCASLSDVVTGTGEPNPGDGDYARALAERSSRAHRDVMPVAAKAGRGL